MNALFSQARSVVELIPRDYQRNAHDEAGRLWDGGERGVLNRVFTGGGKTIMACMAMRTWLKRGPDHYCIVISYERDLVWQFAQEIQDFLGITPGIEMADQSLTETDMPRVVVASRATLLPVAGATTDQLHKLAAAGLKEVEWLSARAAAKILRFLLRGREQDVRTDLAAGAAHANDQQRIAYSEAGVAGDSFFGRFLPGLFGRIAYSEAGVAGEDLSDRLDKVREDLDCLRQSSRVGRSRLHKFDWRKNWLVFYDEAHRFAHSLRSVGHIVDWFDRNPNSRRGGLTATPKRGDGISIGHKMFPAVAIDYPLYHVTRPCAVKQGWAKPYVQKYIEVESVDFKSIRKIAGDFDEAELERVLGEEGQLAKLVAPLLDLVGDRRTLIFNPGVEMAKNVAAYINARVKARCYACQKEAWYAAKLIGEAECACGRLIDPENVIASGAHARSINGATPTRERKAAYLGHQSGKYQFLSVCGLCREGYNDPDVSCVAVFRPVSSKASSLAEQMKGRGCRPCRSIIPVLNQLLTAEERAEAIASSDAPNCLVVDLTGITGLADCASTVQIYADGLDDDVVDLASRILEGEADDKEMPVAEAIERAQAEIEHVRTEQRRSEEAAARAKAQAQVRYTEHAVGSGSNVDRRRASEGQYRFIALLGMTINGYLKSRKAGRLIGLLKQRMPFGEAARKCGLKEGDWERRGPTDKQLWRLGRLGVPKEAVQSGYDASQIIGAWADAGEFENRKMAEIRGVADNDNLSAVAKDIALAKRVLPADAYARLVNAGKAKRAALVE